MAVRSSTKLCSCDVVRGILFSGGHQAAARDATISLVTETTKPSTCDALKCPINLHQSLAAESCFIYRSRGNRGGNRPTETPLGLMPSIIYDRPLHKTYVDHLKTMQVSGIVQFVQAEDKLETTRDKTSALKLSVVLLRLREQVGDCGQSKTPK